MHLTRQSRQLVTKYCKEQLYYHLLLEFTCDDECLEDNIKDTIAFYQNFDKDNDWRQIFMDKVRRSNIFSNLFQ